MSPKIGKVTGKRDDDKMNQDDFSENPAVSETLDQEDLLSKLDTLTAENAALKEQALRYAAEAENTKRRAEKESNDARAFAIQRFARDLFDVADNLARALGAAPKQTQDPALANLIEGIRMTENTLQAAFQRNGLKQLNPGRGEKFDPHSHQAMMEQPSEEVGPGNILMTMQAGYELFGRTLRPALVAVAAKSDASFPRAETGGYTATDPETIGEKFDQKA